MEAHPDDFNSSGIKEAFLGAAYTGDMPTLQRLAAMFGNGKGPGENLLASLKTPEGCNALHLAASAGKTTVCRFLVEKLNFDINCTDQKGETPLFQAILGKNRPTTIYFIQNGADVLKSNIEGSTPLHYAAEKGTKEIAQLLITKGADLCATSRKGKPLHCAATHGNRDVLKYLLDLKEDPNSPSRLYISPLMHAMLAESIECMELLLKAGADPNGHSSPTLPLCYAASETNEEMIRCLLKSGANPDATDCSGLTALEHAALTGCRGAVQLLFPVTSRISSYPNWSIIGVMKHVRSIEATTLRKSKQKEKFLLGKSKGGEAFERKDYLGAMYWYAQAVLADRTDAKVLSNRSLCWTHLNQGEPALEDAQTCVALKPRWAKAHYREGAAWNVLKNYKKAAEAFSRALELDPRSKETEKAYRAACAERDKGSH